MSLWLALVLVGQFLLALVALIDKYIIVSETVVFRPFTYAFWVSVLSAGSVLIYLFSWIPVPIDALSIPSFQDIHPPSLLVFALSVTAGYAFFTALLSMFTALKYADASDVTPLVGALTAIFTFLLSTLFLETSLPPYFFYGFVLLVVGTLLISRFRLSWRVMLSITHAGIMFGVHYIAIKALFNETNFDTAFFFSRLAIALVALSMLLIPEYYEKIRSQTRRAHARDGTILITNKLLGGLASILILKAIEFGDVSLVQALGGLQYLFILGFTACCGRFLSTKIGEHVSTRDVVQKLVAIPLIVIGFFVIFLQ